MAGVESKKIFMKNTVLKQDFIEAREFQEQLQYKEWENFRNLIYKAKAKIEQDGLEIDEHIREITEVVNRPQGGSIPKQTFNLSEYAAYLIALEADPKGRPNVQSARSFFARSAVAVRQYVKAQEEKKERREIKMVVPKTLSFENVIKPYLNADEIGKLQQYCQAQSKLMEAEPKVNFFDAFLDSEGYSTIEQVAKQGKIKVLDFYQWLKVNKYIYKRRPGESYRPTMKAIKQGLMVISQELHEIAASDEVKHKSAPTTYITPKGVVKFLNEYK